MKLSPGLKPFYSQSSEYLIMLMRSIKVKVGWLRVNIRRSTLPPIYIPALSASSSRGWSLRRGFITPNHLPHQLHPWCGNILSKLSAYVIIYSLIKKQLSAATYNAPTGACMCASARADQAVFAKVSSDWLKLIWMTSSHIRDNQTCAWASLYKDYIPIMIQIVSIIELYFYLNFKR